MAISNKKLGEAPAVKYKPYDEENKHLSYDQYVAKNNARKAAERKAEEVYREEMQKAGIKEPTPKEDQVEEQESVKEPKTSKVGRPKKI